MSKDKKEPENFRSQEYPYAWDAYVVSFKEGKSGPVLGTPLTDKVCNVQSAKRTPQIDRLINLTGQDEE